MSATEVNLLSNDDDSLDWRKSSFSAVNGNCVEIAFRTGGGVAVRDTKAKGLGPVLSFSNDEWSAFLDGIAAGEMRGA
ncbi:DUF397 domain-containing protein [Kineosporia sp. NBRC 101731]|uniref:DUF397 domain-containing protein n=1 Tax=Kineosporia sp. NBRC 101731 TaxID=3032199 RepID=UPI0024A216EB|nr:DUF397 domain-containing protein [Kineosporia sp. NBRC 101731]GLY29380.1 hypothetical protein Kisp02_27450 [Kineosporia sp. NBRC 101731]